MNLDLLYMIPLYFGNDIIPKYIHFLFALLTASLVYNYLKNRISPLYGLIGSLFFLSIPIIVKLSITVYVDLGLMFFTTASLLLIFHWLNSSYKIRYLLLAGICCGLAAGTKYNGLISIFLLSLFIPVLYMRSQIEEELGSNSKALGFGLLFVFATLLAFSPWLIRNYAWTGNPIYPLHNSFFQQTLKKNVNQDQNQKKNSTEIIKKLTSRGSNIFANRKVLYHETWWQALLLPIRFFFEGQDDNPRYFDGRLNPFLFILPFFAFFGKTANRQLQLEKYTLLAFASLFFFFTFFQEALRIRYIVCIVPALTILSIFGLHTIVTALSQRLSPSKKFNFTFVLMIILGLMFGYNVQYITQQFQIIQPLSYLRGYITKEQYITRFRPEFPVIEYANNLLQRDTKVLCMFLGKRGYYMNFEPIFDRPTGGGVLTSILKKNTQENNLQAALSAQDIHYILLRNDLTQYWHQHLSEKKQKKVSQFFQKNTKKLFANESYSFYGLLNN
jgi:4-amino-4-deoxy-L-arabinose transferase-like glycosyltransferase